MTAVTCSVGTAIRCATGTAAFIPVMCLAYRARCSADSAASTSATMVSAVRHISVSVCAGSMTLTRIRHGRNSIRNASAAASSANLLAA